MSPQGYKYTHTHTHSASCFATQLTLHLHSVGVCCVPEQSHTPTSALPELNVLDDDKWSFNAVRRHVIAIFGLTSVTVPPHIEAAKLNTNEIFGKASLTRSAYISK